MPRQTFKQIKEKISSAEISINKRIFVIVCIVVILFIPETVINQVSDFIVPQLVSVWGIAFFVFASSALIIGQFLILRYVGQKSREIRDKDRYLRLIYRVVLVAQCILTAILLFVMTEILLYSQYHSMVLLTTVTIAIGLNISILILFAQRFFSWYKSNRSSTVVLLYGLSFALDASIQVLSLVSVVPQLLNKEPLITPQSEVVFPSDYFEPGTFIDNLFLSIQYTDTILIGLLVVATALLLRHYAKKIGSLKFWVIILLPIVYKFSTAIDYLGLYVPSTDPELFNWYIYGSLNSTAGGILFGFAFWTIANTIRQESMVKEFMRIAAFGFVLIFMSNQITLVASSYPPYGMATMCFLPLATYMLFLGIYSTAISISQDNKLRGSIRKLAAQNSNLLGSIGTAHMEQEIQKTVKSMKGIVQEQEKELEEQTGIEANLEEDEMKNYLEEVMQEVGKAKKPST